MSQLNVHLHQPHINRAAFDQYLPYLQSLVAKKDEKSTHLYLLPELFLAGYPPMDLCFDPDYQNCMQKLLKELDSFFQSLASNHHFLIGALEYSEQGLFNSLLYARGGEHGRFIYRKESLPNYDIFDEKRYYQKGENQRAQIEIEDFKIGLLICEDLWAAIPTNRWSHDLDLIASFNASPYHLSKGQQRIARVQELHQKTNLTPIAYVNSVCAQDELIFDGASFLMENKQIQVLKSFQADGLCYQLNKQDQKKVYADCPAHPRLKSASVTEVLSDLQCEELLQALCFGLQEYAQQCGFQKFLIGLSGGIDSGVVAAIARLSLKDCQHIEAVYLPSQFSSSLSLSLAQTLSQALDIELKHFPIKFLHSTLQREISQYYGEKLEGLSDENIQSRLRGLLLMTRANQTGAMLLNTSNRSELAVGYSTLYGDSIGALSVIGDLYKTEVYQLAHYMNRKYGLIIPQEMIDREPSAELRPDQKDSDSLPNYQELDLLLERIHNCEHSLEKLVELGHQRETVIQVKNLVHKAQFKRQQFCPILKIKGQSFGLGHRMPISSAWNLK